MRVCIGEKRRKARSSGLTCLQLAIISTLLVLVGPLGTAEDEAGSGERAGALTAKLRDPDGGVVVVAHRGCWAGGAPENSIAAIDQCVKMGVDMVEVDVALSRDGVPILLHDESLERTTGVSGHPSELDWAAIRKMRLLEGAGGAGALRSEETLPSLRRLGCKIKC